MHSGRNGEALLFQAAAEHVAVHRVVVHHQQARGTTAHFRFGGRGGCAGRVGMDGVLCGGRGWGKIAHIGLGLFIAQGRRRNNSGIGFDLKDADEGSSTIR
jgi:hypothetical protein